MLLHLKNLVYIRTTYTYHQNPQTVLEHQTLDNRKKLADLDTSHPPHMLETACGH
jgi:hypothetical protein